MAFYKDKRPDDKLVDNGVDQSTDQSTDKPADNPPSLLSRPKSFYINDTDDEWIDDVIRRLHKQVPERLRKNIDRSRLVRVIIDKQRQRNEDLLNDILDNVKKDMEF